MERTHRQLKQERDEVHRELVETRERAKDQARQLRDAHSQRRLAMDEFTEINDRQEFNKKFCRFSQRGYMHITGVCRRANVDRRRNVHSFTLAVSWKKMLRGCCRFNAQTEAHSLSQDVAEHV